MKVLTAKLTACDIVNKINCVKAVRELSGLGLRESKEFMDRVEQKGQEAILIPEFREEFRWNCLSVLSDNGIEATITGDDDATVSAVVNGMMSLLAQAIKNECTPMQASCMANIIQEFESIAKETIKEA